MFKSKKKLFILILVSIILFAFYYDFTSRADYSSLNIIAQKNQIKKQKTDFKKVIENTPKSNVMPSTCTDYVIPIENLSNWKKDKSAEIINHIKQLVNEHTDINLLDHIFKISGIGITNGRNIIQKNKDRSILPLLAKDGALLMSVNETRLFEQLLKEKDYKKLFEAFLNKELPLNGYSYIFLKNRPPISHILENDKNNSQNIIIKFINLGMQPTYIDLITATSLKLSVNFIESLYQASLLDANHIFQNYSDYSSLTTIAVKASSPHLVDYWLSKGSPAIPDPFDKFRSNALDLINSPKNDLQQEQYLEIFYILMDYNVKPSNKIIVDQLKKWLPNEVSASYHASYSILNNNKLSERWKPFVYFQVFELYKVALRDQLKTIGSDSPLNRCFLKMGNKMLKLAFENNSKFPLLNKIKNITFIKKNELIEQLKLAGLSTEEAIEKLKNNNDLFSKLAMQDLLNKKMQEEFSFKQKNNTENLTSKQNKAILKAFSDSQNNKWDDTVDIISQVQFSEEINEDNKIKLAIKLTLAITTNQSWDIIRSLLEQGATIEPNMIFILAKRNDVGLTNKLYKYGLDLDTQDYFGRNAIFHAVTYNAKSMVIYLINKGVKINVNSNGLDSLDQALLLINNNPSMIQIIEILINSGINILQSHKDKVNLYKDTAPKVYNQLTTNFPQLK